MRAGGTVRVQVNKPVKLTWKSKFPTHVSILVRVVETCIALKASVEYPFGADRQPRLVGFRCRNIRAPSGLCSSNQKRRCNPSSAAVIPSAKHCDECGAPSQALFKTQNPI